MTYLVSPNSTKGIQVSCLSMSRCRSKFAEIIIGGKKKIAIACIAVFEKCDNNVQGDLDNYKPVRMRRT